MASREARRPSVLIVDDERTFADVLAELLTDEGYRVVTAYDGEQALRILRSPEPPDLVLSDVMLPKVSGTELVAEARKVHPDPHRLPFVLLSAGPPPVVQGEHVAFMPKPIRLEDLLDRVQALVA